MTISSSAATDEFVTFRVGSREFCIDVIYVREIRGWTVVTVVPRAPLYIRGVINLRGSAPPIVDLAQRLNFDRAEASQRHVIITAQNGAQIVDLRVDAVSEILGYAMQDTQPAPDLATESVKSFVRGMIALDGRLIGLIKLDSTIPALGSVAA